MKKLIVFICVCLLLASCGKATPAPTEPPYEAQQPTLSVTEPEDPEAVLAYRRDVVEAEMRRCMSTLWSPAEDITYIIKEGGAPEDAITLKADRIYQGLPYTHASASAYSFFSYATEENEKGVYTISGMDSTSLSGGALARQGCDCADTVFWAWSKISNSYTARYTAEMTEKYGLVKVGDYICNLPKLTGSTKPICKENTEAVMYQAYSQLQKGDALVLMTNTAGGHAVMVVDLILKYTDSGEIDGANSYVVIIEQKSSPQYDEESYFNEEIGETVYICGAVDTHWSFETIFKKGYLPVTCKELVDPSPIVAESATISDDSVSINNLYQATVDATRRIAYVTVTIKQDGNVIQQATAYSKENAYNNFSLLAFFDPLEKPVLQGVLDTAALESGTYDCTVSCMLATGNTHEVHAFSFTV